jgi:hypothetical protein
MAISIAAASSANSYPPQEAADFRQQFLQLVQLVQSGDLSGAQQAFASISHGLDQSATDGDSDPFSEVLNRIGQALRSGNLTAAQQALSPFQPAGSQAAADSRVRTFSIGSSASSTAPGRVLNVTA